MKKPLARLLVPGLTLFLFLAAASIMHREFEAYHFRDVERSLLAIPVERLLLALGITLLNYLALTGYDVLALRHVRQALHYGKIALASFIAYVFSYNVGLSVLGGTAVRYRLYSAWGLSAVEIATVVAFCGLTFWLGFFALGGVVFLLEPVALPPSLRLPFGSLRPVGAVLLGLAGAYLFLTVQRKTPLRFKEWEFSLPSPGLAVVQIGLSCLDWTLAALVFYVLLPPTAALSFPVILGIFLLAQIAGVLSHIPGGLGVFDTVVLLSLSPSISAPSILGTLLAFRGIYYLLPLGLATSLLGAHELLRKKETVKRVARFSSYWARELSPSVLALATFVAGAILLFSGATPGERSRVAWLKDVLPLSVLELSHFLGSLAGAGLLLLARGLQQRVDAAYLVTVGLLYTGMLASLLKGLDYEEAVALAVLAIALVASRRQFHRKASLIGHRFTPGWIVAIGIVLLSSVWLGIFSYKHVEYSSKLWWRFAFAEEAPRFLRASVGALGAALVFAVATLLRPVAPEPALPAPAELAGAHGIVAASPRTSAHLALLGDKAFLFSESGNAFIMYGVEGRSWISMGDPVGPEDEWEELAWRFREMADRHGGWTAFYEVEAENLPLYVDLGLTLVKLGEEAHVRLERFSLEGGGKKGQRHLVRKLEKDGCTFELMPRAGVPELLPELEVISAAWLSEKNTREKGFSLGFFDPEYLKKLPLAVVRKDGRIIAFSNLWPGGSKEEVSVDLMRHLPEAPPGVMEYMFVELMLWGKKEGYRWFNLGMAPLSGLESRRLAPVWSRLGSVLYRHGEHFYNFQGLRQYKEKFDPVWKAKYLAAPGGLALPRVVANVAALISGGLRGVVAK